MPNENNLLPEHAQLAAVLDNPEAIKSIKEPTEKMQIAAVQKKPELVRLFTNTTEKVQLSAVIASPESVLLMRPHPPWPASRPWKGCSRRTCRPQPVFWLQPGGWYSG